MKSSSCFFKTNISSYFRNNDNSNELSHGFDNITESFYALYISHTNVFGSRVGVSDV